MLWKAIVLPGHFHSALLVVLLAILTSGCTQSISNVQAVNREAALHSISEQDSGPRLSDKNVNELVTGGWYYLSSGNLTLAKMYFVMALKKEPKTTGAFLGLGRIEQSQGNYPAALSRYAAAEELDPDNLGVLVGQAQTYRLQGRLNEATEKINKAMQIAPDNVVVLTELAILYDLNGQETLAEPLYREILERTPDQAASHNNIGLNHLAQNRYQEAVAAFHQAMTLDPTNKRVKNNLATAYALLDNDYQALTLFKETVGEAGAYNNLGYLKMKQEKYDEAEKAFLKALDLNPKFYSKANENLEHLKHLRAEQKPN